MASTFFYLFLQMVRIRSSEVFVLNVLQLSRTDRNLNQKTHYETKDIEPPQVHIVIYCRRAEDKVWSMYTSILLQYTPKPKRHLIL